MYLFMYSNLSFFPDFLGFGRDLPNHILEKTCR